MLPGFVLHLATKASLFWTVANRHGNNPGTRHYIYWYGVKEKWKVNLIESIYSGIKRLGKLQRKMPDASRRGLHTPLKQLIEYGSCLKLFSMNCLFNLRVSLDPLEKHSSWLSGALTSSRFGGNGCAASPGSVISSWVSPCWSSSTGYNSQCFTGKGSWDERTENAQSSFFKPLEKVFLNIICGCECWKLPCYSGEITWAFPRWVITCDLLIRAIFQEFLNSILEWNLTNILRSRPHDISEIWLHRSRQN